MSFTVGDLAKLARVSVRTLHHYDEIGLLEPSGRSESGYRLYTESDLERLQQVLFFRELGFTLEDIGRMLRDPKFDRREALVAQRALLVEKGKHLRAMVAAIDRTLDALEKGITMAPEDMFEVFGDFDPSAYEDEVKERWGSTDAYTESKKRTKRYTKEDWKAIRTEFEEIGRAWAAAFDSGAPPGALHVMDIAERARLHIDRWFYPCSRAMHSGLGQLYVDDPRFAANYEKIRAGLTQYICGAIRANGKRV